MNEKLKKQEWTDPQKFIKNQTIIGQQLQKLGIKKESREKTSKYSVESVISANTVAVN